MSVDKFIQLFLKPPPPKSNSPVDVRAKLLHWIAVANTPEQFIPPNTPPEVSATVISNMRRKARQNIRRLAERHPAVKDQLIREKETGE